MSIVKVYVLAVIVLFAVGCSSAVKSYRYYRLKPLAETKESLFRGGVGVSPVDVPEWLDQQSLAWSDGEFRIHKADLDRWGEPLVSAITRITAENINAFGKTSQVTHGPWLSSKRPDRTVDIELLSVTKNNKQVVLDVRWEIVEKNVVGLSERRQFAREYEDNNRPEQEKMVEAFSFLLSDMAKVIATQLRN